MSVANKIIATWDGANRRAYMAQGSADFYPIEDIYHEYRYARRTDEVLRKYNALLRAEGNVKKGGGAFTPRYVVLLEDFKIIPYNESTQINQLGDMITDDPDVDPTLYDTSTLTVPKVIYIKPSEAETIQLNSEAIVYSSFQGAVWVDVNSIWDNAGTSTMPNGNTERPVNDLALAVTIANDRGFRRIMILESMTIGGGVNVTGFALEGVSSVNTSIHLEAAAICNKTVFKAFTISGTLDGDSEIKKCIVGNLEYFDGYLRDCTINGVIKLSGVNNAVMERCKTLDVGIPAVVDFNNSTQNLVMPNWSGPVEFKNCTEDISAGIGVDAGRILIHDSCTAGIIATSGSGTLTDLSTDGCYVVNDMTAGTDILNLQRLVEYMRPHHTGSGNIWFWDPYGGNDLWDGKAVDRAFKTFTKAHDSAVNAGHDIIICVSGDPTGLTISNEQITISKDYLFLRGPGRDFNIVQPDDNLDAITITGRGVEVSGLRVATSATSTKRAVYSTGDFALIKHIYIYDSHDGIEISSAEYSIIDDVKSHHNSGYGVKVSGVSEHVEIIDTHIGGNGGSGLIIDTIDAHEVNIMGATVIHNNQGYGLEITATAEGVIISPDTAIFNNALGDINDLGTGTHITTSLTVEEHGALLESSSKSDVITASQL